MEIFKIGRLVGIFGLFGVVLSGISIWLSESLQQMLSNHPAFNNLLILIQLMFCPANLLPLGDLLDKEGYKLSQGFVTPLLINLVIYLVLGLIFAIGFYWKRTILYVEASLVGMYWLCCIFASLRFIFKKGMLNNPFLSGFSKLKFNEIRSS